MGIQEDIMLLPIKEKKKMAPKKTPNDAGMKKKGGCTDKCGGKKK
jgi:hypothetical protein